MKKLGLTIIYRPLCNSTPQSLAKHHDPSKSDAQLVLIHMKIVYFTEILSSVFVLHNNTKSSAHCSR